MTLASFAIQVLLLGGLALVALGTLLVWVRPLEGVALRLCQVGTASMCGSIAIIATILAVGVVLA